MKKPPWICDFCGAEREYNKPCPNCFSKKRPSTGGLVQSQCFEGEKRMEMEWYEVCGTILLGVALFFCGAAYGNHVGIEKQTEHTAHFTESLRACLSELDVLAENAGWIEWHCAGERGMGFGTDDIPEFWSLG